MDAVWTIAANIFRQCLRNRILSVLFIFALSVAGLSVFLSDLAAEAEFRLARDFGLLAFEWIGFLTILLAHVVLLFEETELKTISILLVKPVRRWQYLLGKALGSILLLAMNQAGMLAVLYLTSWWHGVHFIYFPFLVTCLYLFLENCLFTLVILLFSVWASSVPACAIYSIFVFCLGHFTTNLLQWVIKIKEARLAEAVRVLYYLLPNLGLFNFKDTLVLPWGDMTAWTFLWPLAYGLLYGSAVLLLAIWQYEGKEY